MNGRTSQKSNVMAGRALRPPHAIGTTPFEVFHIAERNGVSACNRGAFTLHGRSLKPAAQVPWGARCRRGRCNAAWLQIPDLSGAPHGEPEGPRRPNRSRLTVSREVTGAQLLTRDQVTFQHRSTSPWGWRLTLDCGHVADRPVQYRLSEGSSSRKTRRTAEDIRPAPATARCAQCAAS